MSEQANESAEGSSKVSPKKIIIIVVSALLLVVLGGVGAFFVLKSQMGSEPAAQEEHGGGHKMKHGEPAVFFDMTKPFVVDFPKSDTIKFLQIAFSFAVDNEDTVAALKKNEPMLRGVGA